MRNNEDDFSVMNEMIYGRALEKMPTEEHSTKIGLLGMNRFMEQHRHFLQSKEVCHYFTKVAWYSQQVLEQLNQHENNKIIIPFRATQSDYSFTKRFKTDSNWFSASVNFPSNSKNTAVNAQNQDIHYLSKQIVSPSSFSASGNKRTESLIALYYRLNQAIFRDSFCQSYPKTSFQKVTDLDIFYLKRLFFLFNVYAVRIQAVWKGYKTRHAYIRTKQKQHIGSTRIARRFRYYQFQKKLKALRNIEVEKKRVTDAHSLRLYHCARKIQKYWRAHVYSFIKQKQQNIILLENVAIQIEHRHREIQERFIILIQRFIRNRMWKRCTYYGYWSKKFDAALVIQRLWRRYRMNSQKQKLRSRSLIHQRLVSRSFSFCTCLLNHGVKEKVPKRKVGNKKAISLTNERNLEMRNFNLRQQERSKQGEREEKLLEKYEGYQRLEKEKEKENQVLLVMHRLRRFFPSRYRKQYKDCVLLEGIDQRSFSLDSLRKLMALQGGWNQQPSMSQKLDNWKYERNLKANLNGMIAKNNQETLLTLYTLLEDESGRLQEEENERLNYENDCEGQEPNGHLIAEIMIEMRKERNTSMRIALNLLYHKANYLSNVIDNKHPFYEYLLFRLCTSSSTLSQYKSMASYINSEHPYSSLTSEENLMGRKSDGPPRTVVNSHLSDPNSEFNSEYLSFPDQDNPISSTFNVIEKSVQESHDIDSLYRCRVQTIAIIQRLLTLYCKKSTPKEVWDNSSSNLSVERSTSPKEFLNILFERGCRLNQIKKRAARTVGVVMSNTINDAHMDYVRRPTSPYAPGCIEVLRNLQFEKQTLKNWALSKEKLKEKNILDLILESEVKKKEDIEKAKAMGNTKNQSVGGEGDAREGKEYSAKPISKSTLNDDKINSFLCFNTKVNETEYFEKHDTFASSRLQKLEGYTNRKLRTRLVERTLEGKILCRSLSLPVEVLMKHDGLIVPHLERNSTKNRKRPLDEKKHNYALPWDFLQYAYNETPFFMMETSTVLYNKLVNLFFDNSLLPKVNPFAQKKLQKAFRTLFGSYVMLKKEMKIHGKLSAASKKRLSTKMVTETIVQSQFLTQQLLEGGKEGSAEEKIFLEILQEDFNVLTSIITPRQMYQKLIDLIPNEQSDN